MAMFLAKFIASNICISRSRSLQKRWMVRAATTRKTESPITPSNLKIPVISDNPPKIPYLFLRSDDSEDICKNSLYWYGGDNFVVGNAPQQWFDTVD